MEIRIPVTTNFSFKRTVISHGWYGLLPFSLDRENWRLSRVIALPRRRPVNVSVDATKRFLRIRSNERVGTAETAKIVRDVRHILRLDDDLDSFYSLIREDPDFAWIQQQGAGRLMRSPTVFEDLVKMICTTNCSWALTEKMVTGLVENLGSKTADGHRSFPGPQALADMPLTFFVDQVRAGYRAPYLKELAERIVSGELNVEEWVNSQLPTTELAKQIKTVKGAGDYAAENLLKLLGRYDGLALDSWTRAKFFEVRNKGKKTSDKKIARFYSRFNEWRGLVLWCDMTRDWLE
jgi:N-glycosylase/DNA lyase